MSERLRRLLYYWKTSLADAENLSAIPTESTLIQNRVATGRRLQHVDWISGYLPDVAAEFFPPEGPGAPSVLTVLIAPFVGQASHDHLQRNPLLEVQVTPFWLLADMHRDGRLTPPASDERVPMWVRREYLDPCEGELVLGRLVDLDDWLDRHRSQLIDIPWSKYIGMAYLCLEELAGGDWEGRLRSAGYAVDMLSGFVVRAEEEISAGRNLMKAYEELLSRESLDDMPLLARFAQPTEVVSKWPSQRELSKQSLRHVGHMEGRFGLSPSQRESLLLSLSLNEGDILPINGPPGTGKTTLIQDLVASLFVQAALDSADAPPVVLVSSANNKAVTNVLDALQRVGGGERWLPAPVGPLGIFLTNTTTQAASASEAGHLCYTRQGGEAYETLNDWAWLAEAEEHYLGRAAAYLRQPGIGLGGVIAALHRHMQALHNELNTGLLLAEELQSSRDEIARQHGGLRRLQKKIAALRVRLEEQRRQAAALEALRLAWVRHQAKEPVLVRLLAGSVGFFAERRRARDGGFWQRHPDWCEALQLDVLAGRLVIETRLSSGRRRLQRRAAALERELRALSKPLRAYRKQREGYQQWQLAHAAPAPETLLDWESDPREDGLTLQSWLDCKLRRQLFLLALRYWEGRYLLATRLALEQDEQLLRRRSPEAMRRRWQRLAMLTPCCVSTTYTAPGFFLCYERRGDQGRERVHNGAVDWLIIDEAGQVSPELAAPLMALASRAVIIGDTAQIPPVWGVTGGIDYANAAAGGLVDSGEDFERFTAQGLSASGGSVMRVAQTASRYARLDVVPRGPFLAHHRRCRRPIIEICNSLSYQGRIIPMRPEPTPAPPLPAVGYGHVPGRSEAVAGSRINPHEAETIAAWIVEQAPALEAHYGRPVSKIIGVITPFRRQADLIRSALHAHDPRLARLTIGTVHALQGAERPVVLFSPVYTTRDKQFGMIDNAPNLLNVGISRAQDSFLVFGDLEILSPSLGNPRGVLARSLFRGPGEPVAGLPFLPREDLCGNREELDVARDLETHRAWLAQAFSDARQRLILVSPSVSARAIEADGLVEKIQAAIERGVVVEVYVDRNIGLPQARAQERDGLALLEASPATVYRLENLHTMALCVDERYYIQGTFGWLSSNPEALVANEVSFRYEGERVARHVRELVSSLENWRRRGRSSD